MILIAELDEERRTLLIDLISEELGREAVGVSTARAMLARIKETPVELLILNPRLPDVSGREAHLIAKLRDKRSALDLPIVALASETEPSQIAAALDDGCNDCITFPLKTPIVMARLRAQLRLAEMLQRLAARSEMDPTVQEAASSGPVPPPTDTETAFPAEKEAETIPGPMSLKEWIRHMGNAAEEDCVAVIAEMARALEYAHKKHFIHREISSDSVTVFPDGLVAINGITVGTEITAEGLRPDPVITNPIRGMPSTPIYAAPEQLKGGEADHRADIYIFGNLAYEILTGRPPFYGSSLSAVVDNQIKNKPQSLIKVRADINLRLEQLVFKCIEKDPARRFQTSAELVSAIDALYREVYRPRQPDDHPPLDQTLGELEQHITRLMEQLPDETEALETLVPFVADRIARGDKQLTTRIKNRLTEPILIDKVLSCLDQENVALLYAFFETLSYNRAVIHLLNRFNRETDTFTKQTLGELAALSADGDLISLVTFGLELKDRDACTLLKAFGQVVDHEPEPIYLKWAKHRGLETQMELLHLINTLHRPDNEVRAILELYASGKGTLHREVKELSAELLRERF